MDRFDPGLFASLWLLHMIDEHWETVLRINATTGDASARLALNEELRAGL